MRGRGLFDPLTAMEGASSPPDMQQTRLLRQAAADHMIPLSEVLRILNAKNLPPQVRQTPYFVTFANANAQLCIPGNPQRMGFVFGFVSSGVNQATDFVTLSYGPPPNNASGIPIPHLGTYQEGNGTVSIDDLWINAFGVTTFPFTIACYEAVLAIESHLHQQTQDLHR